MKTFRKGGIHPAENKLSAGAAVETFALPETVTLPLSQHIGAPATPVVAVGDHVVVGQLVAEASGFVSARVHASVSGTVVAIETRPNPQGIKQPAIVIRREEDEWAPEIDRSVSIVTECTLSGAEIIEKIRRAGIVGLGGATFPTHVKLTIPAGRKAEFLIVNGAECEPYLTSDQRVMTERSGEVLQGARLLARALGVGRVLIGIENNKPEAIARMTEAAAHYSEVEVVPLRMKYPQGGEKQLIAALTGREVPPPPALPIDVGAVVSNASTVLAVYEAVQKDKPLIERVVTVTGKGLKEPKNLLVRLGTPMSALIEAAGGLPEGDCKVLGGGPMMGRAMIQLDAPVTKGCSGITVLSGAEALRRPAQTCIKCAKCVAACPMGLEPYLLSKGAQRQRWEALEASDVTSCIECGCCQATCPAHLPLLDWIRLGKQTVSGLIRARAMTQNSKK